ncbi:MAG: hypothetical protein ACOCQG_03715 [Candidatus Nanoarchaeia archaeon]
MTDADFSREIKNCFKQKNTIEDYIRDFRLELDDLVTDGRQNTLPLPGSFKTPDLKNYFLSICQHLAGVRAQTLIFEDENHIEKMNEATEIHYGNQLPSPSLFEQYKKEVHELIENEVYENHNCLTAKKMGREKFLSNCPGFTNEEFIEIFSDIYKNRKETNDYIENYLVAFYETIFSFQEVEYSELMDKIKKESFGNAAAKNLSATVEKAIYASIDITELVNIEKRLLQKFSAAHWKDPGVYFKKNYYRNSDKEAEDKINNFTLKIGTAVENFTEFIRKFYQIKEPQNNGGDLSKIKHIIYEFEKGDFEVNMTGFVLEKLGLREIIGYGHSTENYKSMLQEVLPKQLKNAFLYNDVYREFKDLRNNGTHSTILNNFEELVFYNGIHFTHKNNDNEHKLIPAVSYLQDFHREITTYMLEIMNTMLAPATTPIHFIPTSKDEHGKPYHSRSIIKEIRPKQALKEYQTVFREKEEILGDLYICKNNS